MKIILIAVITIIGISLFSAFKQSEGSKKYLTLMIINKELNIIDENGTVTEKKIPDNVLTLKGTIIVNKEINSISSKGYKLIANSGSLSYSNYIFEKE